MKSKQKSQKNQKQKNKKKVRILVIVFSIIAVAIIGVILWLILTKTNSCKKPENQIVHVVQPTSSQWELTVNNKKEDFEVKTGDKLDCVVKSKSTDINVANNDAVMYYIQVKPLNEQTSTKIYPFELSYDSANDLYSTSFEMYWNYSISISITSKTDYEDSYYKLDKEGNVDYVYTTQNLFDDDYDYIEQINVIDLTKKQIKKTEFDEEIYVGSNVETIYPGFLCFCTNFNSDIHFEKANKLTSISNDFLWDCFKFNKELNFPATLKTISGDFMYECKAFNQKIDTKNVTTLDCTSFMYKCESFNSDFVIGNSLTNLPQYFLSSCTSFNKNLVVPSNIKKIGDGFMVLCNNMVSTLTINCPLTAFSDIKDSINVCSTNNKDALCYKQGIKVNGDYGNVFRDTFKNISPGGENKMFRNLISA